MTDRTKPMCTWTAEELVGCKKREKKFTFQGNKEHITYYEDGSSTRHCGGPCGDQNYDKYGQEC